MWNYNQTVSSEELYHYGIKGMKWGVRRARNRYEEAATAAKNVKRLSDKYVSSISKRASKKPNKSRESDVQNAKKIAKKINDSQTKRVEKRKKDYELKKSKYEEADKKKNPAKYMSDSELRKKLNRLQMEKQYSQLTGRDMSKGKKALNNIIKAGTTVATVTGTALTIYKNTDKIKSIINGMIK